MTTEKINAFVDKYFEKDSLNKNLKLINKKSDENIIKFVLSRNDQKIIITYTPNSAMLYIVEVENDKLLTKNINTFVLENKNLYINNLLDYLQQNGYDNDDIDLPNDDDNDDEFKEYTEQDDEFLNGLSSFMGGDRNALVNFDVEFVKLKHLWEYKFVKQGVTGSQGAPEHTLGTEISANIVINELLDLMRS